MNFKQTDLFIKERVNQLDFVLGDFRNIDLPTNVQTYIVDPPYNINFNYRGGFEDKFTDEQYKKYHADMLDIAYNTSLDNASMFLINTPKNTLELYETMKKSKWQYNQIINWIYPNNMGRNLQRFTPCTRYITWLVKSNYKKDIERLYQPYKEDSKKTRAMIAKGRLGANLYDWWEINLVKNVSPEKVDYANQIPKELLKRLIITTTDEDDLVADLNCGSGSTLIAANELKRNAWGCDVNKDLIDLWESYVY